MSTNVVALKSGGQIAGIIPQSIEEVYRLSKYIASSGLAPQGMNTPEQITVAIMTGLEIGLPPMFAVQKIAVINGRPTIWGDAVPALLWSRGFKLQEWTDGDENDRVAHCKVTRPDGTEIERTYSVKQAIKAGLWQTTEKVRRRNKAGEFYEKDNDSPWFRFQERMLPMRARGYACRDGAADVLSGLYLTEEMERPPMRDITPERPAPLEIPDIPDVIDQTQPVETVTQEPDTITDVDGYLSKLESDRSLCESDEELKELADGNADLIARLPAHGRKRAAEILKAE